MSVFEAMFQMVIFFLIIIGVLVFPFGGMPAVMRAYKATWQRIGEPLVRWLGLMVWRLIRWSGRQLWRGVLWLWAWIFR